MLKLGEAHRALGYVSRFLCARGAPAPAITAAPPGEAAAYTPLGSKTPLHEFDAMVMALASGAPALARSAARRSVRGRPMKPAEPGSAGPLGPS